MQGLTQAQWHEQGHTRGGQLALTLTRAGFLGESGLSGKELMGCGGLCSWKQVPHALGRGSFPGSRGDPEHPWPFVKTGMVGGGKGSVDFACGLVL